MKKVVKKLKKVPKNPSKYIGKAWEEFLEEAEDFFDDFYEDFFKKKRVKKQLRKAKIFGTTVAVRPAYLFAEKVENVLKVIFGISIFISGLMASFWGFTRTSELLTALINSFTGRIFIRLKPCRRWYA